jgi:proline iminopeptidase
MLAWDGWQRLPWAQQPPALSAAPAAIMSTTAQAPRTSLRPRLLLPALDAPAAAAPAAAQPSSPLPVPSRAGGQWRGSNHAAVAAAAAAAACSPLLSWHLQWQPGGGSRQQAQQLEALLERGLQAGGGPAGSCTQALLECHYSMHGAFLLEQPLLAHVAGLRSSQLPCIAVQGCSDRVCPPATALDLQMEWPEVELVLVPGAGHSHYDPGITHELLEATDRMLALL